MDVKELKTAAGLKLKVGQSRRYKSGKGTEGKGEITRIEVKKTGAWVTLSDVKAGRFITLRPSEVAA